LILASLLVCADHRRRWGKFHYASARSVASKSKPAADKTNRHAKCYCRQNNLDEVFTEGFHGRGGSKRTGLTDELRMMPSRSLANTLCSCVQYF
jgi:hypothetical protein